MSMWNNGLIDWLVVDKLKIFLCIGKVEYLFNAYSW